MLTKFINARGLQLDDIARIDGVWCEMRSHCQQWHVSRTHPYVMTGECPTTRECFEVDTRRNERVEIVCDRERVRVSASLARIGAQIVLGDGGDVIEPGVGDNDNAYVVIRRPDACYVVVPQSDNQRLSMWGSAPVEMYRVVPCATADEIESVAMGWGQVAFGDRPTDQQIVTCEKTTLGSVLARFL